MNLQPVVSVIVRSMDRPELERALASIAAQDAPAEITAEVLVVAACGLEHRPVPSAAGRYPIRLVTGGGRLDRPCAANAGLDAAHGRFITFLDDDDELLPGQFRLLLAPLGSDTVDLVHARAMAVATDGRELHLFGGPWIEHRQLTHGFFQLASMMFRRELLERGVRFDERFDVLEDMDFFVQCAQVGRFHYLATPVFRYYVTAGTSGTADGQNSDPARVGKALALLREKWKTLAERLESSKPARLERAVEQIKTGVFAAALVTLSPVLEMDPEDVNALNLSGLAHVMLGHFKTGEKLLKHAMKRLPNHPGIKANLELLARKRSGG